MIEIPSDWTKPKFSLGETVFVDAEDDEENNETSHIFCTVAGLTYRPDGKDGWWYSLIYPGQEFPQGIDSEHSLRSLYEAPALTAAPTPLC
jgi:hypothetical protein